MKEIFVVDDEKKTRELIAMYLKKEGYKIRMFSNAKDALDAFCEKEPDLIVLDIVMDGMDGLDLCKQIRRTSEVPIIFVSARTEEFDRVLGLELGADDYITKPFSMRELTVRIKVILKRCCSKKDMESEKKHDKDTLLSGDFVMDTSNKTAKSGDKELFLTMKEYDVLEYLMRNMSIPKTRGDIIRNVWGYADPKSYERNVDDTIKRIRRKLKDVDAKVSINTIWGYGYRLDEYEKVVG